MVVNLLSHFRVIVFGACANSRSLLGPRDRFRRANIGEDEVTVVPNLRWCPLVKDWASHQGKQSPQRLGAVPRQHASYLQ